MSTRSKYQAMDKEALIDLLFAQDKQLVNLLYENHMLRNPIGYNNNKEPKK